MANEIIQMSTHTKRYFSNPYNYLDMVQLPLTLSIILSLQFGWIELDNLRLMATYDTLFLWIKIVECLKATEVTAIYARLIIQTFRDMSFFLMIIFGTIMVSSVTLYIFFTNAYERGEGEIDNYTNIY